MQYCNCGREVRYSHFKGDVELLSCNKHIVCPTYKELLERNKLLEDNIHTLMMAARDVVAYRESSDQYKEAEEIISKMLEK